MKKVLIIAIVFLIGTSLNARLERDTSTPLQHFQVVKVDKKSGLQIDDPFPGKVPGDLITDLAKAGLIEHPFYGYNSLDVLWINDYDWAYRTELELKAAPGKRTFLLARGIDYHCRISLNDSLLQEHTGMYSWVLTELTPFIKQGSNNLEVLIYGQDDKPAEKLSEIIFPGLEFGRRSTLKQPMGYGWNIAPRLKALGIWDRLELIVTGPVIIKDLALQTKNTGEVEIEIFLDSIVSGKAMVSLDISPDNFSGGDIHKSFELEVPRGESSHKFKLMVPEVRLWWSFDLGEPNLYQAVATVSMDGHESDSVVEVFGFREVKWEHNPGINSEWSWVLRLNGKRIFMRGANWVPVDSLAGGITTERYYKHVDMARKGGINLLRVWGGGGRERDDFYDACDRAGIMVWQEFPFACVYIIGYPKSDEFMALARQETEGMVRILRNHPSLVLWCGGNEVNVFRNSHVLEVLEEITAEMDPELRFIKSSPWPGDDHNWIVWHAFANLNEYLIEKDPMISEFGVQSLPSKEVMDEYFPGDPFENPKATRELWHHHSMEGMKLRKYLAAAGTPETLDEYITMTQTVQAHFYKRAMENWRRQKYTVSGYAFWKLNSPWPSISKNVIDYNGNPKLAYDMLLESNQPVLIMALFDDARYGPGDRFDAEIYLVNDLHRAFAVDARIKLGDKTWSFTADIEPDSVKKLGTITGTVGAPPLLTLEARSNNETIATNHYLLNIHDPLKINPLIKLAMRVHQRMLTGRWP